MITPAQKLLARRLAFECLEESAPDLAATLLARAAAGMTACAIVTEQRTLHPAAGLEESDWLVLFLAAAHAITEMQKAGH